MWIQVARHSHNLGNPLETYYEGITNPDSKVEVKNALIQESVREFNCLVDDGEFDLETLNEFLKDENIGMNRADPHGSVKSKLGGTKGSQWIHSRYKGFIGSRIYLGSNEFPADLKEDYKLDWEKGSLISILALKYNSHIDFNLYTASTYAYTELKRYAKTLPKTKMSSVWKPSRKM